MDKVHLIPTSEQKEEIFIFKKIDDLQESKRILVHKSKEGVALAIESSNFFMDSLRNPFVLFFLERL